MMKKITAICFILTATIILMAHAVVPHHYHNQQVCVEESHCLEDHSTNDSSYCTNLNEHKHQHDGHEDAGKCVLGQELIVPSNQINIECKCSEINSKHQSFTNTHFAIIFISLLNINPVCQVNADYPDISYSYYFYLSNSYSLRGPPMV